MGLIPIWIWLLLLAGASVVGFGSGWTVKDWQWEAKEKSRVEAQLEEIQKGVAAAQKSGEATEKKLAAFKVIQTNKTFYNEYKTELTKTVYTDPNCYIPESGWVLRNQRIREANQASEQSTGKVSASSGNTATSKEVNK